MQDTSGLSSGGSEVPDLPKAVKKMRMPVSKESQPIASDHRVEQREEGRAQGSGGLYIITEICTIH
eukprot:1657859-Amphidinium_carterae.1